MQPEYRNQSREWSFKSEKPQAAIAATAVTLRAAKTTRVQSLVATTDKRTTSIKRNLNIQITFS